MINCPRSPEWEVQWRAGGSTIFEVFYDFGAGNKLVQVGVDVLRNPAIELIENSPGLSATLWLSGPVFIFTAPAAVISSLA